MAHFYKISQSVSPAKKFEGKFNGLVPTVKGHDISIVVVRYQMTKIYEPREYSLNS